MDPHSSTGNYSATPVPSRHEGGNSPDSLSISLMNFARRSRCSGVSLLHLVQPQRQYEHGDGRFAFMGAIVDCPAIECKPNNEGPEIRVVKGLNFFALAVGKEAPFYPCAGQIAAVLTTEG